MSASGEINNIRAELSGIINELESIESGIRRDFQGIGNDVCAARLGALRSTLSQAHSALGSIDMNALTPEFEAKLNSEQY